MPTSVAPAASPQSVRKAQGRGSRRERFPLAERLLDVHEAAVLLAVKAATLYQWAYQRRVPVVKLFGARGALRFRESDLLALIARSVRPALRASDGGGMDP